MCLTSMIPFKPLVAEEDIICYKVLVEEDNKLFSPMHSHIYELNTPNEHVPIKPIVGEYQHPLVRKVKMKEHKIERGYHSFARYSAAETFYRFMKRTMMTTDNCKPRIVQAIIPKGTTYYEGTDNRKSQVRAYASETITIMQ